MDKRSFQVGINLGGWISQYSSYDHEHFRNFITSSDIERIAGWGMDHVRLPFDYPVLEDENQPGLFKESGFDYIESCLEWCQKNNLRVILDLHKAPGFSFDKLEGNYLFSNPDLQERFLALWDVIARRFAGRIQDGLAFELLNEVVLPDSAPWNALASRALVRIRAVDSKRLVVVGGINYNIPEQLKNLQLPQDDNLLYTFHYYRPFSVTHQLAPWIPFMVHYGKEVDYPGEAIGLHAALENTSWNNDPLIQLIVKAEAGTWFDKEYLRAGLKPAIDFISETGQPLYCGEFGIYTGAGLSTRLAWMRDFIELLNEYHIGRSCWTYKEIDFGLVDLYGHVVNQDLVDIVTRR